MEWDELKAAWRALDERVGRLEWECRPYGRGTDVVRRELRPLIVGQAMQVVLGACLALGGGSFWFDHRHALGPLIAGLLLHVYGIAAIVAAARNLVLASRASASQPVLDVQGRLAELRAWRIREGRWLGIAGCFAWVAMVVWAFAQVGVDIVAARPVFVGFLMLTAVVCLAVFLVVNRLDRAPEGRSVRRARERLDEVARFAREERA